MSLPKARPISDFMHGLPPEPHATVMELHVFKTGTIGWWATNAFMADMNNVLAEDLQASLKDFLESFIRSRG